MQRLHYPTAPDTTVVSDPRIMGGTPCVRGTRIPAETILIEIEGGTPRVEIFHHYPSLPLDGIEAVMAWDKAGRPA